MSTFRRPESPYWYVEFVVQGHRIVRSSKCTSRKDAKKFEQELKQEVRRRIKSSQSPSFVLTIDQACGRYWLEHGHRLRDAINVERWLGYVTAYMDKGMPLGSMRTRHVTAFVNKMRSDGIGDVSINRTLSALQGVHNMAAKRWEEPVATIDWQMHRTKELARTVWITQTQADALLERLPDNIRNVVLFILYTGVRKREAFELVWQRVHLDRGSVSIVAKGGIEREVDLSEDAIALLSGMTPSSELVFDTTNWRRRFDEAKEAVGLPELRWHDLRHTFATWLGQTGAPLDVIKEQLGHSSIAVTQKYRHVARREVRNALSRMPAIGGGTNIIPLRT